MARYGEAVTRAVRAVSAATGLPVTGDAANIDLYVVQDSGSPAPVSGSITEEGYGYYSVDLTAAENTCWTGRIIGESSTSNVVIIGVQWDNHSPVEDVADAVWDEDLGGHTVEDSAGQELHLAKVIVANDAETDETTNTIAYDDDDGSVLATHTITDTPTGKQRTLS